MGAPPPDAVVPEVVLARVRRVLVDVVVVAEHLVQARLRPDREPRPPAAAAPTLLPRRSQVRVAAVRARREAAARVVRPAPWTADRRSLPSE